MKNRNIMYAAVVFAVAGCSTSGGPLSSSSPSAADDRVPAAIAAPTGAKLAMTLKGSGLQNYECRPKAGVAGGFDWTLLGPEAALRDKSDALVGRHYAGPTWEYADGSKVTGTVVADAAAPASGSIPWLLLKGTSSGNGAFAGTTYVQRIATSGGTAPSEPCNASLAGTKKATRYSADYRFYKS